MEAVTISSKYQVVIPREVRAMFNLMARTKNCIHSLQWHAACGCSPAN